MAYFNSFPLVPYYFGNEKTFTYFENIGVYVDLLDQIVDDVSFYNYYTIIDGDRPDTVSYKFYDTTDYHWTFYLLNQNLRECGWPLTLDQVEERAKEYYPNYAVQIDGTHTTNTVTDSSVLGKRLQIGTEVSINSGAAVATVISRNLDIGQIVLKYKSGTESALTSISEITYSNGLPSPSDEAYVFSAAAGTNFYNNVVEYNAPHHYENNGVMVDIDPFDLTTAIAGATPVTNYEYYQEENDGNKQIRVLKPDVIRRVTQEFNRLVRS